METIVQILKNAQGEDYIQEVAGSAGAGTDSIVISGIEHTVYHLDSVCPVVGLWHLALPAGMKSGQIICRADCGQKLLKAYLEAQA